MASLMCLDSGAEYRVRQCIADVRRLGRHSEEVGFSETRVVLTIDGPTAGLASIEPRDFSLSYQDGTEVLFRAAFSAESGTYLANIIGEYTVKFKPKVAATS